MTASPSRIVCCLTAIFIAGMSGDLVHAETLGDAIALAYQSNPTLQAQRAQLRALDEEYVQARAGWRPQIGVQATAGYSKTHGPPLFGEPADTESNSASATLSLSQPLYTGGQTTAAVLASRKDILAGRESLRATEGQLLTAVIQAYYDVLRDQMILAVRESHLAEFTIEAENAEARFKAGEVTRTDVAQIATELAQARSAFSAARGQLQNSRAEYTTIVGQNPGQLAPSAMLPGIPRDIDQAFNLAEADSPTLNQARLTEEASHERIAQARAAGRPTISLNASLGYNGVLAPAYSADYTRALSAEAVITQPIYTGGVNTSNVRKAIALNTADRISIETARRNVVQAVAQAWNNYITARATIISEAEHVRVAQAYYDGAKAEYTVGQRTTLDIVFADESLIAAQVAAANSEHDAYVSAANVLNSIGRLEVRYLTPSVPRYSPERAFSVVQNKGSLPWEGLVALADGFLAPKARANDPITVPRLARGHVTLEPSSANAPSEQLSGELPTRPDARTTSPNTPARIDSMADRVEPVVTQRIEQP